MREVELPSGAKLKIDVADFADSKALFQALMDEAKGLDLQKDHKNTISMFKDIFCIGFSSKRVEVALDKCFSRVLYNDLKIDKNTFQPEESRQDYIQVCLEVATDNVMPFLKNLYAQFSQALARLPKGPA